MIKINDTIDIVPYTKYFGPATVAGLHDSRGHVRIVFNRPGENGEMHESWARLALPMSHELQDGDTVLVAGDEIDGFYIIGILESRSGREVPGERLELRCGVRAEVSGVQDGEKLSVFSETGELIFEYDPFSGKTRVTFPRGDLEIDACDGSIVLSSSKDIRLVSSDRTNESRTALIIDRGAIGMNSPKIDITAQTGSVAVEEMTYTGSRFFGTVTTVKLVMNRLESAAETVIEKTKNIYRTVEGLTQLCTGRMRTIVNTTFHMKSKRTFMKAEEDFKVKGEKIYLG